MKQTRILFVTASVIVIATVYLSYVFYKSTIKDPVADPNKIKSTEVYSIDSLKKETIKPYQAQIDTLKSNLSSTIIDRDTLLSRKAIEYKKLRKNYDSVINKLEIYRDKLNEIKT